MWFVAFMCLSCRLQRSLLHNHLVADTIDVVAAVDVVAVSATVAAAAVPLVMVVASVVLLPLLLLILMMFHIAAAVLMYFYLNHDVIICIVNLFTTIHDGNFRRHSSMNVTIK